MDDRVRGESFDAAMSRSPRKRPADSDTLLILSDAKPNSGAKRARPVEAPKPEPPKRVRVLAPYQVVHDGTAYYPNTVARVPASVADDWLLNRWVTDDGD